LILYPSFNQ